MKKVSKQNILFSVTPFSKMLALLMMVLLPVIAFLVGMSVQRQLDEPLMKMQPVVQY